jgi:hypothetical protein
MMIRHGRGGSKDAAGGGLGRCTRVQVKLMAPHMPQLLSDGYGMALQLIPRCLTSCTTMSPSCLCGSSAVAPLRTS